MSTVIHNVTSHKAKRTVPPVTVSAPVHGTASPSVRSFSGSSPRVAGLASAITLSISKGRRTVAVRRLLALAIPVLMALLAVFVHSGFAQSALDKAGGEGSAGKGTALAPLCDPNWALVDDPGLIGNTNYLASVTAASADDVWAVGNFQAPGSEVATLVEHWDGTAWSVVPSPNAGTLYSWNYLHSVVAVSADNMWAVGYYENALQSFTLVEHWDGITWSVVPSPNPDADYNTLYGVAAVSADNVWAVGSAHNLTLIEHWDGTAWSVIASPNHGASQDVLYGAAVASAGDVWAVGTYSTTGGASRTLIEHWNGISWSLKSSTNPGLDAVLGSVAVVSAGDVWSVGFFDNGSYSQSETLVEHWDGSTWSTIPSPSPGQGTDGSDSLRSVAGVSANDVWAVGATFRVGSGTGQTLVEHWDGSTWSAIASPSPGNSENSLNGVATVSNNDVWAAGESDYDTGVNNRELIERYNPCPPAPSPTATSQPPPCPGERFTDVCPPDYYYTPVQALADDGILSGYNSAPPCNNSLWIPCFNPHSSSTRGQISKVVSLAAGFADPVSGQIFEDVPPGSTFYTYTQRMASRSIISGYPCGGPGAPCVPPSNLPYFRTNNSVTRGQLSKMISLAFAWNEPIAGQRFQDVTPGGTFYDYIGRLYVRGIINGYPCGGAAEPCIAPANLPYFRPNNNVIRGQTAKIVQLARTQPSSTPIATPSATLTPNTLATK